MTCAVDVTPIEGDASKLGAGPILSDGSMVFEDIAQVVCVAAFDISDTRVINH